MTLKFLQINVFKGKFLDELVSFIKETDPDICAMQEVSSGKINFYMGTQNTFEILKERLGWNAVFYSDVEIVDDPLSLFGNAVFSKYPILKSNVVPLKTFRPVTLFEFNNNPNDIWADLPRHMLDATVDFSGMQIHAVSVHGRRVVPPIDSPESTRQAKLMTKYLKSLGGEPFIVGGDFNMPPETEVIKIMETVSGNLMADSGVKQTLNPKVHELGEKGYLVDFIFTSKHFKKISLDVPQVTVSDHLPVVAELEFEG